MISLAMLNPSIKSWLPVMTCMEKGSGQAGQSHTLSQTHQYSNLSTNLRIAEESGWWQLTREVWLRRCGSTPSRTTQCLIERAHGFGRLVQMLHNLQSGRGTYTLKLWWNPSMTTTLGPEGSVYWKVQY